MEEATIADVSQKSISLYLLFRVGKQQVLIQNPTDFSFRGCAEIDTRADTICAGSTFIQFGLQECLDVSQKDLVLM